MLPWGIPLCIFLFISGIWIFFDVFLYELKEVILESEISRITPLSITSIYVTITSPILAIGLIAKSTPPKIQIIKKIDRLMLISTYLGLILLILCIFVITPLQYYAMPKLGYTRCNILEGHPNMYFTDWVKNPDWCVRGKSREWVREQARLAKTAAEKD